MLVHDTVDRKGLTIWSETQRGVERLGMDLGTEKHRWSICLRRERQEVTHQRGADTLVARAGQRGYPGDLRLTKRSPVEGQPSGGNQTCAAESHEVEAMGVTLIDRSTVGHTLLLSKDFPAQRVNRRQLFSCPGEAKDERVRCDGGFPVRSGGQGGLTACWDCVGHLHDAHEVDLARFEPKSFRDDLGTGPLLGRLDLVWRRPSWPITRGDALGRG